MDVIEGLYFDDETIYNNIIYNAYINLDSLMYCEKIYKKYFKDSYKDMICSFFLSVIIDYEDRHIRYHYLKENLTLESSIMNRLLLRMKYDVEDITNIIRYKKFILSSFILGFIHFFPNTYKALYLNTKNDFLFEKISAYSKDSYTDYLSKVILRSISFNSYRTQYFDIKEIKRFYNLLINQYLDIFIKIKEDSNKYFCKEYLKKLFDYIKVFDKRYISKIELYIDENFLNNKDLKMKNEDMSISKESFSKLLLEKSDKDIIEGFIQNLLTVMNDIVYYKKSSLSYLNIALPNYKLEKYLIPLKFLYIEYKEGYEKSNELFAFGNNCLIRIERNEGFTFESMKKFTNEKVNNEIYNYSFPISYKDSIEEFMIEFKYLFREYEHMTKFMSYYPNTDTIELEKNFLNEY